MLIQKGFDFNLEAHPLAAFFKVAKRDDLTGFVEDLFDDTCALLETLIVVYGLVELWVFAPHYFEARYGSCYEMGGIVVEMG